MARFSANLSDGGDKILAKIAKKKGTTKNEILRRAIALMDVVYDEEEKGNRLTISDTNDKLVHKIIGI